MAEIMRNPPRSPVHRGCHIGQCTKYDDASSQLTDFHRFSDLPPELRQMIFQACLPRRVFRFSYGRTISPFEGDLSDLFAKKPSALPPIAFVCKEAYYMAKLFVREFLVDRTDVICRARRLYGYGTERIRFDPVLDSLFLNYRGPAADEEPADGVVEHEDYLKGLRNGPFALALDPKINVILSIDLLVGPRERFRQSGTRWLTTRPYRDCLTQRSHCTVNLATTRFFATNSEINSSGLFGMFGEERTVIVDINDTAKIDQYESYSRRHLRSRAGDTRRRRFQYFPEDVKAEDFEGAGRYSSFGLGALHFERTHGEDDAAIPTMLSIAEQDAASALYLIKQSWLQANHCFEPDDDPLVPWTGDVLQRKWDDEHPVAKYWLSKLPTFSYVVNYQVTTPG